jgi:hypothetical protein
MAFDFARNDNDPGLAPLRTDRLALAMRDVQVRRKALRWCGITEWLAVAVIVVVVFGLLVALP